jgi:hypothetical protein
MKIKKYVMLIEENDGFMYFNFFNSKKKAIKAAKKAVRENNSDEYRYDNVLPVVGAFVCKTKKTILWRYHKDDKTMYV